MKNHPLRAAQGTVSVLHRTRITPCTAGAHTLLMAFEFCLTCSHTHQPGPVQSTGKQVNYTTNGHITGPG